MHVPFQSALTLGESARSLRNVQLVRRHPLVIAFNDQPPFRVVARNGFTIGFFRSLLRQCWQCRCHEKAQAGKGISQSQYFLTNANFQVSAASYSSQRIPGKLGPPDILSVFCRLYIYTFEYLPTKLNLTTSISQACYIFDMLMLCAFPTILVRFRWKGEQSNRHLLCSKLLATVSTWNYRYAPRFIPVVSFERTQ